MTDPTVHLNAALEGRYRIEREIGEGGMATVYLAEDVRHHRPVAIKVLKPELAAAVGAERFLAEIETTANLRHPHILPLFDSGEADGLLFFVMPFVEGESLRDRLDREGRLPVEEALAIAREAASALSHAHSRGVVHRDVKPANILLGEGGALVADFGIALAVSEVDRAQLTATGVSLGTPSHMSPEQISGDAPVDHRSDVYALGALLYEMLAGEPPFSAPNLQALLTRTLTSPVPSVREIRPEVPAPVADAISRALAKEPEGRFQSAREFGEACAALAPPEQARRTPALALAVAAIVIAAGVAFVAWRSVQTSNARSILPEIARLVDEARYVEAYELAAGAERWLPDDPTLDALMAETSDLLTVTSEPTGAEVFIQRFAQDPTQQPDSQRIGVTPVQGYRVPRADHRVVVALEGFNPVERVVSSGLARELEVAATARELSMAPELRRASELPEGTVPVDGGEYELVSPDAPLGLSTTLNPFFIDRSEVTNEAYKAFVDAGGYAAEEYWADAPRDLRSRLVDRTGLPGPREWARQEFPAGQALFPVAGVTWYEAQAYCRSVGRRLPTVFEWEKTARDGETAHRGVVMPWGYQGASGGGGRRANFSSSGPVEVDAFPFGVSPYGAHDMAGNVQEWTANPMGDGRVVTGGSWDGPSYLYTEYASQPPDFASPSLGFRCAVSEGAGNQGNIAIGEDALTPVYEPVDEATFRSLLSYYRYDPILPNPRVTETQETSAWTRERVWIDGPQGDSVLVYFYAPRNVEPPYQTILFAASAGAFITETVAEQLEWIMGPVVQGGRAAVGVVLKGMVERGFDPDFQMPDPPTVGFRDLMVLHATELRLGLDYALSRGDVDNERIAYVGVSFGAGSRLVFSAVDDRYRSVIYLGGGIDERVKPTLPEADNVNFAPYVRVPKLLLNGRSDEEHPWLTRALPLWNLMSEPRELVLVDGGGHVPQLEARIPAMNDFLDRTLGPVGSR
jgi:formylglycine-generating enzyme required for sulfatase activity/tRNA A-37 threonylcarbamoyl transferase component Bud32/pimeloyl-ACP methyl ester carboxylesterase